MDWSRFDRKIRITTNAEKLFDAWAQPESLKRWFLAKCEKQRGDLENEQIVEGDVVSWTWHNYPNTSDITYFKVRRPEYMEFSFGAGMHVSINIAEESGICLLHLRQFNIPIDDDSKMNYHVGCRQAWSSWLMNLKSWLEHGNTLHDKSLGMRPDLFDFVNT